VPKTLIFAKDDAHAENIVEIVREEFGKGNDFAQNGISGQSMNLVFALTRNIRETIGKWSLNTNAEAGTRIQSSSGPNPEWLIRCAICSIGGYSYVDSPSLIATVIVTFGSRGIGGSSI
jgi:hypothetical protein